MALEYIRFFGFDFVLVGSRYQFFPSRPSYVKDSELNIKPSTGSSNKVRVRLFYLETNDGVILNFSSPFEIEFKEQHIPHLNRRAGTPKKIRENHPVLFELGTTSTNQKPTGLDIDIGPFRLKDQNCDIDVHAGNDDLRDIWVKTQQSFSLLQEDRLPLSIHANAKSFFRVFHANSEMSFGLQFTQNPFTLTTKLGRSPSLLKRWQIHHVNMDINALPEGVILHFLQDKRDPDPLYLHPFLKADKHEGHYTLASLGLDCAELQLTLKRNDNADNPLLLDAIKAIPRGDKSLHAYSQVTNTEDDGYHRWQVKSGLNLAIRMADHEDDYHGLLLQTQVEDIPAKKVNSKSAILGVRREVKLATKEDAFIKFDQEIRYSTYNEHISETINKRVTTPYLRVQFDGIAVNRPGVAMSTNGSDINAWAFLQANDEDHWVQFPLCPDEAMLGQNEVALSSLHETCNDTFRMLESDNQSVTHESNLKIDGRKTNNDPVTRPTLKYLFNQPPPLRQSLQPLESNNTRVMTSPRLGEHINRYNFGNYMITKTWQEGEVPEYIALITDENGNWTKSTLAELKNGFPMDPDYSGDEQNISVSSLTINDGLAINNSNFQIVGIVKLGKENTLVDILQQENVSNDELDNLDDGGLTKQLPQKLQARSWTGLILFEQNLDLSNFSLLESLLPTNFALKLRFLAVSPDRDKHFSTYGLVSWKNPNLESPRNEPSFDSSAELRVQMAQVDITWAARNLTGFMTKTRIECRSFAGARKPLVNGKTNFTRIEVLGSIDKETEEIRFLAQASKPIPLLDEDNTGVGPIKQVLVKQIEISRNGDSTRFSVDGDLTLQSFDLGSHWNFDKGDKVRFDGLKFSFDNNLELEGNWLNIDYPSLRFDFAKGWKLMDFGGFNLEIKRIAYDTKDSEFDWGNLLPVINGDWKFPSMRLGLELNLGKLPLLSQNPFEELTFDFELALPFKGSGANIDFTNIEFGKCRLYLRALGFNKLNLKLMRFLEISADRVVLENKENNPLWLFLQGLKLKILDKTIIEDFTFGHYWLEDKKGFIGLLNNNLPSFSLITIDWLLVGRNLLLNGNNDDDLVKAIVSIEPNEDSLKDKIGEAFNNNTLIPSNDGQVGEWVFAAGFKMFDEFLLGKFLFHDGAYYGLAIEGPIMKKMFGYELAISVLYIVKSRPEEDLFRLSFRVPSVSLGGIAFNGGVIVLEIQMNGSFLLDMGYPWLNSNGERQWERGFGVMISGLMGRGGSFIAMRSSIRTKKLSGARRGKLTLLEGGQAAMVGIGGDFSAGPLRVTAYAGIYYTCEGALLFFTPEGNENRLDLIGLRLSGSIGIQARGIAELDWWIISIRVEVVAGAEARLTLFWGALEHHQSGSSDLPSVVSGDDKRIGVRVDFVLYARVSARACIGSGWLKVCKSVSVGISMPYQTTLYLT